LAALKLRVVEGEAPCLARRESRMTKRKRGRSGRIMREEMRRMRWRRRRRRSNRSRMSNNIMRGQHQQ